MSRPVPVSPTTPRILGLLTEERADARYPVPQSDPVQRAVGSRPPSQEPSNGITECNPRPHYTDEETQDLGGKVTCPNPGGH